MFEADYVAFSKAFNKVTCGRLVKKVKDWGIGDKFELKLSQWQETKM